MFIQTESTPNPATLKFLPGREVLADGALDFADAESAAASPLAAALFEIDGVEGVFLGADFITITKAEDVDWPHLKPLALAIIMDHFTSGAPVLTGGEEAAAAPSQGHGGRDGYSAADLEVVEQVVALLDEKIRPAVARDGGDILFDRFEGETGTIYLHLRGACAGCPASTMTLKQGVENMLRHYIPEVETVEAVL
ncbi:MAG: NifU family protein [Parvularculaceae bacterium]